MNNIIRVEGLGKKYIIDHQTDERYTALRDVIARQAKSILRKASPAVNNSHIVEAKEDFWALRNISFDIHQGDRVGIIGRNGAGKSTLLKLLSRITEPSEGRISIRGRVASLLEVGTGFHPELTGRENIFLNGAILGMARNEIKKKFDEIVAFAEVEKFLDTPVKRYSSGMYVRLAFAVAAHLEPEILIVDEVLAVGDAAFQKKCLGKMEDVSKNEGRTVLFVSHNMQTISTLTNHCILLGKGKILMAADTQHVISEYGKENFTENRVYKAAAGDQDQPAITLVEMKTSLANSIHVHGKPCEFEIEFYTPRPLVDGAIAIQIFNELDVPVTHFWFFDTDYGMLKGKTGTFRLKCLVPSLLLYLGTYTCTIYFSEYSGNNRIQTLRNICQFEVVMYGLNRAIEWQPGASTYLDKFEWTQIQ